MSILSLVLSAGLVVKLVMLLLLLASVVSWIVIVQRGRILAASKANLYAFEDQFWSGIDLNDLYRDCQQSLSSSAVGVIFMAGFKAFSKRCHQQGNGPRGLMGSGQLPLRVATTREIANLDP